MLLLTLALIATAPKADVPYVPVIAALVPAIPPISPPAPPVPDAAKVAPIEPPLAITWHLTDRFNQAWQSQDKASLESWVAARNAYQPARWPATLAPCTTGRCPR